MSVALDQSADAAFVRFVARFCGVNLGSAASGRLRLRLGKHTELYEPVTIAKYLARCADRELELLGQTPFERAQVAMWMTFARGIQRCPLSTASSHWLMLSNSLQRKTYLVANRVTLADAALFYALHGTIRTFTPAQYDEFADLVRWFDQVQHTAGVQGFGHLDIVDFPHTAIAFTA